MKKSSVNFREWIDKYQSNCERINDIANVCEKEQRERTDAESAEFESLVRENQLLQMRMQAATADHLKANPNAEQDAVNIIRENAKHNRKTEISLVHSREFTGIMVSDAEAGGIVPLNIGEFVKPLQEGFILDKVGLPMPTGLVGDFVWPTYEFVDASVAGEGVALSDSKINFSKLTASPERIGIAVPVTNQALNASDGIIEMIVREVMPIAVRQLLNKIVFGTAKVSGASNLVGPYAEILVVDGKRAAGTSLSDEEKKYAPCATLHVTPTFEELNKKMKAAVLERGIEGNHLCWTMTKSMKAVLEGQPINSSGVYVPIIADDKLCGLPVYTTNEMRKVTVSYKKATKEDSTVTWADYTLQAADDIDHEIVAYSAAAAATALAAISASDVTNGDIARLTVITEYIGIGDWSYQPMGLFGSLRFTVDPYSQARKDSVDFVLNADYATKTLRPEAFMLAKCETANS